MTIITSKVIASFQTCDTSRILKMYDTSFSHINQTDYRNFIKEHIHDDCKLFNQVVKRHGLPNLKKLTFLKDSISFANVAALNLLNGADTTLNMKSCVLYILFHPDELFDNKILRVTIYREALKKSKSLQIEQISPIKQ